MTSYVVNADENCVVCVACPQFYEDDSCDSCEVFLMYRAARLERGEANA